MATTEQRYGKLPEPDDIIEPQDLQAAQAAEQGQIMPGAEPDFSQVGQPAMDFSMPARLDEPGPPPAPPAAPGLAQQMPLENQPTIQSYRGVREQAADTANTATAGTQIATTQEQDAQRKLADAETQEAQKLQPVMNETAIAAHAFKQFQEKALGRAQAAAVQFQQNYQKTTDDLNAVIAQSHPTDIFGAAGIGRVQGSIALALGAIGTLADGRNVAVERLDQMARQRTNQLREEANLLGQRGEMQKSLYGAARERLGDDMGAYSAVYQSQLEAQKAEIQRVANQFRSPRAQAGAQQAIAGLDKKLFELNAQVQEHAHTTALSALVAQDNAAEFWAQLKASQQAKAGPEQGTIPGYVGSIPDAGVHAKVSEINQGARSVAEELDRAIESFKNGKLSIGQLREMMAENSIIGGPLRKFLQTGTRLEGDEKANIDALRPGLWDVFAANVGRGDPAAVLRKLEVARDGILRSTIRQTTSASKGIVGVDKTDPIFGPYLRRAADEDKDKSARDVVNGGTPKRTPEQDVASQFGYR